jgi:hypothetical protein
MVQCGRVTGPFTPPAEPFPNKFISSVLKTNLQFLYFSKEPISLRKMRKKL